MTHELVGLPAFVCLGLEAEGPLDSCQQWVPRAWLEFMRRAPEIAHVERQGLWGLTSDPDIFLAPWGGLRGKYLASCRVPRGTEPFGDWKIWEVPAACWMKIPCRLDQVDEAFDHMRAFAQSSREWRRDGAIHELYPDDYRDPATDILFLMAPLAPR